MYRKFLHPLLSSKERVRNNFSFLMPNMEILYAEILTIAKQVIKADQCITGSSSSMNLD